MGSIVPGGGGRGLVRSSAGQLERVPRHVVRAVEGEQCRALVAQVRIEGRTFVTNVAINHADLLTSLEERAASTSPVAGERARVLVEAWLLGTFNDVSRL